MDEHSAYFHHTFRNKNTFPNGFGSKGGLADGAKPHRFLRLSVARKPQ